MSNAMSAEIETVETKLGTVTLGGRTFTAEHTCAAAGGTGNGLVILTGPRGGTFFLRGYLAKKDAGVYQVISFKSGAPLRDKCGREVHAFWMGDIIEDATR